MNVIRKQKQTDWWLIREENESCIVERIAMTVQVSYWFSLMEDFNPKDFHFSGPAVFISCRRNPTARTKTRMR
jgi:hypothetical protein